MQITKSENWLPSRVRTGLQIQNDSILGQLLCVTSLPDGPHMKVRDTFFADVLDRPRADIAASAETIHSTMATAQV